jgi:CheY-like chemotaxis protein
MRRWRQRVAVRPTEQGTDREIMRIQPRGFGGPFSAALRSALSDHNKFASEDEVMSRSLLRILVVDDDRDTADSLAVLLSMSGHPAQPAYDAASALNVARQSYPYLVFLDLAMPGVSGFRLAEQLRGVPGMEDSVLVCITGYAGPNYQEAARQVGFTHFLLKPIDPQEVVRLVDDIIDAVLSAV